MARGGRSSERGTGVLQEMSLYILESMGTTPLGALLVGWVTDLVSPQAAVGLGAGSAMLV
jgi:hypothetical protein